MRAVPGFRALSARAGPYWIPSIRLLLKLHNWSIQALPILSRLSLPGKLASRLEHTELQAKISISSASSLPGPDGDGAAYSHSSVAHSSYTTHVEARQVQESACRAAARSYSQFHGVWYSDKEHVVIAPGVGTRGREALNSVRTDPELLRHKDTPAPAAQNLPEQPEQRRRRARGPVGANRAQEQDKD
ncbi:hypothetical protein AYO21_11627 [Fonsecaea monophora]|uniref:Uncharacterized protein n=1 Tax=Fonsecaea monophora TaxID=254056 RepID=A0A177ERZ6_9EURO|nr:hypothetical protein AYO21_11627 [Fonsecaea monophora]OAG34231.1 hypothetical protein AYO21_11627 [Fonsecaea monophora]